jgi:polyhydroxyalkanoate synthase
MSNSKLESSQYRESSAAPGPGPALDPFGIAAAFRTVHQAWLDHPAELAAALGHLCRDVQTLQLETWKQAAGIGFDDPVPAAPEDERFADPAWSANPSFRALKDCYLLYTRWLEQTVYDAPGAPKRERRQAAFWTRQWFNMLAPSNYFFTNPVAIRKFWESSGASAAAGLQNLTKDLAAGDVQMVDRSAFTVGRDLASTPGAVVFRNPLIELIHYAPLQDQVHATPIVFVPPWINKFYILDLDERKSLVRYLLSQGFDVFMISWRNPPAEMAGTTFEDYLFEGVLRAIRTACEVSGAPQAHAVGYCIGGTALAATMAWLNREYRDQPGMPVAHWSLLASLVEFSRLGEIEAFINEESVATIENIMDQQGFLDGRQLGLTFRMLRPNTLIWYYYVHSYLYGEGPPAFDVLFWNVDTTRLPRAMHGFYLREFYLHNRLAQKNAITLGGHPIDLGAIAQPLYAVGTEEDHITPWRGTFKTCRLVDAPVRYVLSSSGHILGIINPPVDPPKREYWAGDYEGQTDDRLWRAQQQKQPGSWWEDWSRWLERHCGEMRAPPPLATKQHPSLCDAPGTYVLEQ